MGYPHKHLTFNPKDPRSVGMCDYSDFAFNRADLVKQYEYRGDRLVWTGFLVASKFADKPNPQLLNPVLKPDPYPLKNPRPDVGPNNDIQDNNAIRQSLYNYNWGWR